MFRSDMMTRSGLLQIMLNSVAFAGIEPILGVGRKIAMSLRDAGRAARLDSRWEDGARIPYIFRRKDIEGWLTA